MERDETAARADIRQCMDELRANVQELESSAVVDETAIAELRDIFEEIEACLGEAISR